MKCVKIMIVGLAIALLMVGCMLSKRNVVEPKPQTICPVMGGTINKAVYTDYEGKRVYFCWRSCINIFQKDPAKYVKNLEDEGVTLEEASKTVNKNMSSQGTEEGSGRHRACGGCGGSSGCGSCSR